MRIRSSVTATHPTLRIPDEPSRQDPDATSRVDAVLQDHPAGERMRELRAALVGRRPGAAGLPITLVVADPDRQPGAGRLAAELAIASARLGYQVLLVDANVARPELHQLFRLPNEHGVSDMTTWGPDEATEIQQTAVAGLSLLPAGPAVADAAETIERLGLCDRLRRFGSRFDTVLIDVTAQAAPEAAAAAVGSDGMILAVRRGRTPIAAIRRTIAAFADRQVESLGLVPVG